MSFIKHKVFIHFLSFILGAIFIFSAFSKYYPIETFEFTIVETGIVGWKFSLILARIIIALELAIGVLLLFGYNLKLVLKITISLLILFTLHLLFSIFTKGNIGDCGCFGETLPMTPLQGVFKNLILLIFAFILLKSNYNWKLKFLYTPFYIFILCNIFIFTQNAIDFSYSSSYLNKPFENFNLNLDTLYKTTSYDKIGKPMKDIRKEKLILAFFSSSCEHCRVAAKKFSVIKKLNSQIPMYFFINGDNEDINQFKNKTNISQIPSSKLNGETFIQLAGLQLPVIYYYNKGVVEKQVDYYTLEQYHIEDWLNKKEK